MEHLITDELLQSCISLELCRYLLRVAYFILSVTEIRSFRFLISEVDDRCLRRSCV